MSEKSDQTDTNVNLGELRAPYRIPVVRANDADEVFGCVAELKNSWREGRAPDISAHVPLVWTRALDMLLVAGRLDVMEHGIRHLHAALPALAYAANFCKLFDSLPVDDGSILPFHDDSRQELQVLRRENSDTVLILFCDGWHRLGMPVQAVHRWLGRLPASLIYLRDFRRLYYLAGIPSLGPDRRATLSALHDLVGSLGGRRIVCCGNSAGAFGALSYGVELGAAGVLALGATTNLNVEFSKHLRSEAAAIRLHKALPGGMIDLRRAYAEAIRPPCATLVYCGNYWDDRLHAEYLTGLQSVTLKSVPGCDEHNVITALIRQGHFEPLLDELMATAARQ